jgi:hypothetical protein
MQKSWKPWIISFCAIFGTTWASDWGFYGHRKINYMAVFTLPVDVLPFFKENIHYLSENAPAPDLRRSLVAGEDARHYIDLDRYGQNPFVEIPKKYSDAITKFSEDSLLAHGIAPWNLEIFYNKLVWAFKHKNRTQILRYAADLGHYCGDLHVPLHTTQNYNGQLTGQKGIHGLWESRLPELLGEEYDYFAGRAGYVKNVLDLAWQMAFESYQAVDSVLSIEKQVSEKFQDRKYSYEQKSGLMQRVYAQSFSKAYHQDMQGMVEKRMRLAIVRLGSLWYSAWIDAGQPNLTEVLKDPITVDFQKERDSLLELKNKQEPTKKLGREHE